jgi:Methylamine utilisation protein MauE
VLEGWLFSPAFPAHAALTYLALFARWSLAVVFIAAVTGKLRRRTAWASFVAATRTLLGVSRGGALWASTAVLLEASTAACLLVSQTAFAGFVLAAVILTAFLVVIVHALMRGVSTSCNCFGSDGARLSWSHVVRNAALAGLAALGLATAALLHRVPFVLRGSAYPTVVVSSILVSAIFVMWDDFSFLVVGERH